MGKRRGSAWRWLGAMVAALVWLCCGTATALAQQPNVFMVTTTSDSGAGSLRQAITSANATPNVAGQPDRIVFNIQATGVQTIRPTPSELPPITEPVVIDGYTQTGTSANTLATGNNAVLLIELDGTGAGSTAVGIHITSTGSGSTVRGLVIGHFAIGIWLDNASGLGNRVEGNFIGTTATGTAANRNATGVYIGSGYGNTVGGTTPAARNLISGNGEGISSVGFGNFVQGNYIGTNAAGTAALPNGNGIALRGGADTIGGTDGGAGNLVSGNDPTGIYVHGGVGASILGNRVGTDATGSSALGNLSSGINIENTRNVTVGGTATGAANVVSGNNTGTLTGAPGLWLVGDGSGTRIIGNLIGTNTAGTGPLNGFPGSNTGDGILVEGTNYTVGGLDPAEKNVIAFNGLRGVEIRPGSTAGTGNAVLGNAIHSNGGLATDPRKGGLGIDLAATKDAFGVTANDAGDPDSGPNGFQNYPTLSSAARTAVAGNGDQTVVVQGSLDTGAGTFRVEYFSSARCDPSGFGEGERFVGSTILQKGAGTASLPVMTLTIPAGHNFVTATATTMSGTLNNTSEFSTYQAVVAPSLTIGDVRVTEAATGTANAVFTVSLASVACGTVTVQFATADGTAVAGADYQATSGMLTFQPGTTQQQITVAVLSDRLQEGDETFVVNLTNPVNATLADAQARGTIVDDDVSGIVVTPTSGLVTTEGGGTAAFTVALATVPSADVTIALSSSNPAEGRVSPPTLVFTPADAVTPHTVTVTGIDDTAADGNVAYTIVTGAAVSADPSYNGRDPADVAVTNLDNEGIPTLAIADASGSEANAATGLAFTVTLSPPALQPVTVQFATADGTALAGSDYRPATGTLTFVPGQSSQVVRVELIDDRVNEGTETLFVSLANATGGANVARARAQGTIEDDDLAPSFCSPRPRVTVTVAQDGPARWRVTVSATTLPVTPTNRLSSLEFLAQARNVEVDIGNLGPITDLARPGAARPAPAPDAEIGGAVVPGGGFTVSLPDRPSSVTFWMRSVNPAEAVYLPFIATDDCGGWRTFVGHGPVH